MIEQRRQSPQARPVGQPRLDRVETRQLQAADQIGIERRRAHNAMVAADAGSMAVSDDDDQGSTAVNRSVAALTPDLRAAVCAALAACRISDKDAANAMGIDPGRWSRQKAGVDGHFIQLDRLARLPKQFHLEFARIYGGMVGVSMAHDTIAELMVSRVMELLTEVNGLATQLRAMRRTA